MPDTEALTVLAFLGEQRGFDWIRLDASLLPTPVPAPTDADLAPSTRLTPPTTTPAPDPRRSATPASPPRRSPPRSKSPRPSSAPPTTPHRQLQDPRAARARPHRLRDEAEAAAAAKARIDAGKIDFDALAAERGLSPTTSTRASSPPTRYPPRRATRSSARRPRHRRPDRRRRSARTLPDQRDHGARRPPPSRRPRPTSRRSAPSMRPRKRIPTRPPTSRTSSPAAPPSRRSPPRPSLRARHVALNSETRGGLADDPKFRDAAAKAEVGEETDLAELTGGGLVTLRVDGVDPPAVIPLAEVRDRVAADWTASPDRRRAAQLATATSAS